MLAVWFSLNPVYRSGASFPTRVHFTWGKSRQCPGHEKSLVQSSNKRSVTSLHFDPVTQSTTVVTITKIQHFLFRFACKTFLCFLLVLRAFRGTTISRFSATATLLITKICSVLFRTTLQASPRFTLLTLFYSLVFSPGCPARKTIPPRVKLLSSIP